MTNDNPVRILLIDDNPDDRMLALRRLEQEFEQLQSKEITDIKQLQNDINNSLKAYPLDFTG
ncbi:hypothetical protein [Coleofasciculus sp. F4-SAH-05]|uniref:hypothetical protein n=1 Tax=Coleofasciculus sp. F4-SAH-05 TaxID=3069525 RepID=UPI0032F83BF3